MEKNRSLWFFVTCNIHADDFIYSGREAKEAKQGGLNSGWNQWPRGMDIKSNTISPFFLPILELEFILFFLPLIASLSCWLPIIHLSISPRKRRGVRKKNKPSHVDDHFSCDHCTPCCPGILFLQFEYFFPSKSFRFYSISILPLNLT